MPEDEARRWAQRWELDDPKEREGLPKWTPRIVADDLEKRQVLEDAVTIVWAAIKEIRMPCFRHGRPSILFRSEPTTHQAGFYNPFSVLELERMGSSQYYIHFHNPKLPDEVTAEDHDWEMLSKNEHAHFFVASRIFDGLQLSFDGFDGPRPPCGPAWSSNVKRADRRPKCPRCGEFGSGEGTIRNERRFFHARDRSCYLGVVEQKKKRNPLVKCGKCGEMGREHHGKDGHVRIRHADRTCYIG